MNFRFYIILVSIIVTFVACNSGGAEKDNEDSKGYVAIVDTSMTLLEVAKANNIGDPYLRTKLGIPDRIGKSYKITTMAKRFNFTIDELKQVIEDQKNKQASRLKKKQSRESKK